MKKIFTIALALIALGTMSTLAFSATATEPTTTTTTTTTITPTDSVKKCPTGMVQVKNSSYCVDLQKAPGSPVTWGEASAHCVDAGKRLCTASEYHNACLQTRVIGTVFNSTDLEFIDGAAAEQTFIAMQPCELPHEVWNAGSDRYRNYRCCKSLPPQSTTMTIAQ